MYDSYIPRSKITKKTMYLIIDYYEYLYNNLEVKSVPEIARELEISETTLRLYLEHMYTGRNNEGRYSKLSLQILLCTKFSPQSPYYEDQIDLRSFIKKREIVKNLRQCKQKSKIK